jgi:amidase
MRLLFASVAAGYPPGLYRSAAESAAALDSSDDSLFAERVRGSAFSYRDWVEADAVRGGFTPPPLD